MKTTIKFLNHASVLVSDGQISVLSDPWYFGSAFNKGWNLLNELAPQDIRTILTETTHIWLSHEHPDHFSIPFFRNFAKDIKSLSIRILFQKTKDQRVYNHLRAQEFDIQELEYNNEYAISTNYKITCIKDGFYDSGLLIQCNGEKILNLNDCDITTSNRANEVRQITGKVDVLLTQFSYAAWKGGKENRQWRCSAAREKIKTIKLQIEKFEPSIIIPFASFMYFSNQENFYLNEDINKPADILRELPEYAQKIFFMAPFDTIGGINKSFSSEKAIKFWSKKYAEISPLNKYESISIDSLGLEFQKYYQRIQDQNNIVLMRLLRIISPVRCFKPCIIHLYDLDTTIKFDYLKGLFCPTEKEAQLSMHSESLGFIFKNSFGFDAVTINACFEESKPGGFISATKTLAIENLNGIGVRFNVRTLFDFRIMKIFAIKLYKVWRHLIK